MFQYVQFSSKEEALQRSREAWVEHLGRPKKPEDGTEFLWSVVDGMGGDAAVLVNSHEELLKPEDALATNFSVAIPSGPVLEES